MFINIYYYMHRTKNNQQNEAIEYATTTEFTPKLFNRSAPGKYVHKFSIYDVHKAPLEIIELNKLCSASFSRRSFINFKLFKST